MVHFERRKTAFHPLSWIVEPLTDEASYIEKPMFGCRACYLNGRLKLVLAAKGNPWNGLLIPTEKAFHESIRKDFQGVVQHPILKKWLYLPETYEDFERVAQDIVKHALMDDPRFGVEPKDRKPLKRKKTARQKRSRA